ncbi:MAG: hypothetical protein HY047_10965 [Acidobacteria bacterium]|nr:hypothetical protein [Acidobacteriota bacterium]
MQTRVIALTLAACVSASAAFAQQVVRYEPAEKDLKYVYATVRPVATLRPGDTLETKTVDAFGKRKKIAWPRFENESSLMAVGAYRPLDDALRIAFTELVPRK